MGYAVTAPLVIVKDDNGVFHHVYFGGHLPANADAEHVKQLLDGEMVEEVKVEEAPADDRPKGNASREAWAAYAKDKGAPEEETRSVEEGGLTQTALREKYGN